MVRDPSCAVATPRRANFARLNPQPKQHASQRDDRSIVTQRLLVARSEPSRLLQQVERALDFRARLVQIAIVSWGIDPRRRRGQDRLASQRRQLLPERNRAVRLVTQQAARPGFPDQLWRRNDIVSLSFGDPEDQRKTERVYYEVNLGRGSTSRSSNRVYLGPPFPPAAC